MSKRVLGLCVTAVALIAFFAAASLGGQTSAPPTTYSVVEINSMLGVAVTMHIYRDGSRAVIDDESGDTRVRAVYDLNAHKNVSWDLNKPSGGCANSTITGDWGDPFNTADLLASLDKENPKQTGTETINGFATRVLATDGSGPGKVKARVWVDQKYGFIVKAQMEQGGERKTLIEIKSATFAPPPSGVFKIPAMCSKTGD